MLTAAIPYTTHPVLEIGPLTLRTFGLMVAIGVVCGTWFAAVHGERYGMSRDDTYKLGTRMVLAGVVGSRLTWVLTHLDQIDSPIDVIAVWEGGLQFAGGFIAAIAVGLPTFLGWSRLQRWQLLDGYAVAVLIGAAFGRLGCLAVGEHFGGETDFFLATRYEGGAVREPTLGLDPGSPAVVEGITFHNPSLYECATLFVLFGALWLVLRRRPAPGTVGGLFLVTYGVQRLLWDALRVNDERVAGLTGAQWMCVAMLPIAAYVLTRVRTATPALLAASEAEAQDDPDAGGGPGGEPAVEADGPAVDEEPADEGASPRD